MLASKITPIETAMRTPRNFHRTEYKGGINTVLLLCEEDDDNISWQIMASLFFLLVAGGAF
jgi:hypothetical protein